MQYAEYPLTDNGFHAAALGGPGEIWGLDNMVRDEDGFEDDQRFWHLAATGYPDGAAVLLERKDKSRCLAAYLDGAALPEGGTEIAAADVPALLVSEYGWPEGTTLGADGLPVGAES